MRQSIAVKYQGSVPSAVGGLVYAYTSPVASDSFGTTDGARSSLRQTVWQPRPLESMSTRSIPGCEVAPFVVAVSPE